MKNNTRNSLKQAINHKLDEVSLNEDQLSRLENIMGIHTAQQEQIETSNTNNSNNKAHWLYLASVAAFVFAFIASTLYMAKPENMLQAIADEVVHNHLKLKPLEVKTQTIKGVQKYFSKLDFMPIDSTMLNGSALNLLGGRYCSLQGITAAQLRFKETDIASVQTLYQTEYRQDVFGDLPSIDKGDNPAEIYVKGIKVKIWIEKGLLLALTDVP